MKGLSVLLQAVIPDSGQGGAVFDSNSSKFSLGICVQEREAVGESLEGS